MVWPCDVAVNTVGRCAGTLLNQIFMQLLLRPITLVLNCNENVKKLNENLATLDARRQSVQHDVDEAEQRAGEIESEVKNWMGIADKYFTEEARNLRDDLEDKAKKRCFMGLCLNPVVRYKLSKNAEKDAMAVDQLAQQPSQFRRISFVTYDQGEQVAVAAADDDLQDFDSRSKVLKEIMDSMKDPSIKRIGLHGMPGVGKTTLAKEVKRRAQKEEFFDVVVLADVKRTPDWKIIQAEIARDMNLVLPNENESRIAAALRRKMLGKSVLVILDDVWTHLALTGIGIPLENTELKILLTSRDLDVLSRAMHSNRNIKVDQLQDEEAWKLFVGKVVADVERFDLHQIAIQSVRKCGGLPLAIATLGNALKGRESHVWHDALQRLRSPSQGN